MSVYRTLPLSLVLGQFHHVISVRSANTNICRGILILSIGSKGLSTAATKASNEPYDQGVITLAILRLFFCVVAPIIQTRNIENL
jgi:hypothetical protein